MASQARNTLLTVIQPGQQLAIRNKVILIHQHLHQAPLEHFRTRGRLVVRVQGAGTHHLAADLSLCDDMCLDQCPTELEMINRERDDCHNEHPR